MIRVRSFRELRTSIAVGRHALLFRTLPLVAVIVAFKVLVDHMNWEFIDVSSLHTSMVAGAIFIVGLMLTGTMTDYKESERLPTDTAASMEAIFREGTFVKSLFPDFDLDRLAIILEEIPQDFRNDLVDGGSKTIGAVEQLTDSFLEMDRLGVPANYITRLKQEQSIVVRNLMRAAYIQRISFLPSAYTLVEVMVGLLVGLLTFTKIATGPTDAILLGFISLIFLYILRLLRVLDAPFRSAGSGLDDVSLFQIDDVHTNLIKRLPHTK